MKRYLIKHAFNLRSANMALLNPGQYYATDDAAQIAELETFVQQGAVQEIVSHTASRTVKAEAKAEAPKVAVNPNQDLASVPGVGFKMYEKLTEAGFNTVDELRAAILDPKRTEELKKLLGLHYAKIQKHFQPAE